MNIDAKILKKIKQSESNNILKRSYIMTKWALSQGFKDYSISINGISYFKTKDKANFLFITVCGETL